MSNSLQPHESQHARPPCPSPTPGVHSDSHPLSQWCHPAISSSVVPFSSCLQSLLASESFPMSQLFAWGGQSTGVSALASSFPKKSQGWSPSEWTGWISLQSKGLSRIFYNTTVHNHQFFSISPSNEYSGLISFRTDWFDLLAVQGTIKNLLQHNSSKALILWCTIIFFTVAMQSCNFKLTLTGLELFSSSHWTRLIVLSLSLHNPWPWGSQGNKK